MSLKNAGTIIQWVWSHPANRGARARAVLRSIVFEVASRTLGMTFKGSVGGLRLRTSTEFYSSALAFHATPPDWNEMHAWRRLLRPGDVFMDIGANVGIYTLWAHACGADVVAVEPVDQARRELIQNLALNGIEARVRVVGCAVLDKPGTVLMSAERDTTNVVGLSGTPVTATTVDSLLGCTRVRGIKIDVEGAEHLVMRGSRRALKEHRIDVLQVEWNRQSHRNFGVDRHSLAQELTSAGYSLFRPAEDGRLHPTNADGFGTDVFALAPKLVGGLAARDYLA